MTVTCFMPVALSPPLLLTTLTTTLLPVVGCCRHGYVTRKRRFSSHCSGTRTHDHHTRVCPRRVLCLPLLPGIHAVFHLSDACVLRGVIYGKLSGFIHTIYMHVGTTNRGELFNCDQRTAADGIAVVVVCLINPSYAH